MEDEDKARWQITTQFGVKEAHFVVSDVGQTEAEKSDIADVLMNL